MRHVVWDWNGTLLDDLAVVVEAVNDTLIAAGWRPITVEEYGAYYTRPVRVFYERLLGRPVTDDEWLGFDEAFHVSYRSRVEGASLAGDAVQALAAVQDSGLTQSLLSMYWHDELVPAVERLELGPFFVRIDGLRGTPGDRKQSYLEAHLSAVGEALGSPIPPGEVLVIGDALDDAVAAQALGARCVLYDGGAHPRDQLATAGVPVVQSLMGALRAGRA